MTTPEQAAGSVPAATDTPPPVVMAGAGGGGPTPSQAAWIREHAWTDHMRRLYGYNAEHFTECGCQWGVCHDCAEHDHDRCTGRAPHRTYETVIYRPGGDMFAILPDRFDHPTEIGRNAYRSSYAFVWLARHHCRWICACRFVKPVQLALGEVG